MIFFSHNSEVELLTIIYRHQSQGKFQDIINKIKAVNSEMHIFCDFDEKLILSQAEASKTRYANGKAKGPLDGVPIDRGRQSDYGENFSNFNF